MKNGLSYIVFLTFVWLANDLTGSPLSGESGDKKREKKDTASAVVVYGDSMLLSPRLQLREDEYLAHLESLMNARVTDTEKAEQLRLVRAVERMSEADISWMIDSLFSLDEVPYALINEINLYIDLLDQRRNNRSIFLTDHPHPSPHPAQCYYDEWNEHKPVPYNFGASALRDSVYIKLRDSLKFCDYHHPYAGKVTSRFGWRNGRRHCGIDVDLEVWDPIHAAFAGQVRVARYYGGFGRVVVIRHYNGLETTYAHLHRFKVKTGDYVEAGDVIGLGGSSGRSSGSHLHFEVRFMGVPINPEHLIDFAEGDLLGDTLVLKKTPHWYVGRTTNTLVHEVEKGDYLHKIATRYGVSMEQICRLNGIRRNAILRVGQRLRISG